MGTNKKSLSHMAMGLYCQLEDIKNLLNIASIAAQAEEDKPLAEATIGWYGMISLIKKEVDTVSSLAEDLESHINGQIGG